MYNMKQSSSLKELSYFTCLDKLLPSICWLSCVLTVGCVWLSKNKFSSYLPFLRNTILKYEKSSLTLDIGHIYWIPCSGKIWQSLNLAVYLQNAYHYFDWLYFDGFVLLFLYDHTKHCTIMHGSCNGSIWSRNWVLYMDTCLKLCKNGLFS